MRLLGLSILLGVLVYSFTGGKHRTRFLGMLTASPRSIWILDSPLALLLVWFIVLSARIVQQLEWPLLQTVHTCLAVALAVTSLTVVVFGLLYRNFHLYVFLIVMSLFPSALGHPSVGAGILAIGLLVAQRYEWELYKRWSSMRLDSRPAEPRMDRSLKQPETKLAFHVGTAAMTVAAALATLYVWADVFTGGQTQSWVVAVGASLAAMSSFGVILSIRSRGMFAPRFLASLQQRMVGWTFGEV